MKGPILYFLVSNSLHQDQRLHRICSTLSKNQFQVKLVGISNNRKPFTHPEFDCISLTTFFKSGPIFYFEINVRFFFFLLYKNFDGVVANDLDTLFSAKMISLFKSKRLFIDLHEYFTEVPELSGKNLKKRMWSRIGKLGISNDSINYTVNKSLATILEKKYGQSFESIYNFPNEYELVKPNQKSDALKLVYVGKVNKGRGLIESIKALKELKNITLTIIGDGDEYEKIKSWISSNDLTKKVFMKGFMSPHEIQQLLPSFDLALNILNGDSLNYYYSSANKYFDYIMAGIPCISMNFPEYIQLNLKHETSILINECSSNNIRSVIQKIQMDNSILAELRNNCSQARKVFNWNSQAEKLLSIYNQSFNL